MGVAITNGWLIYRRYCSQNKIPKKKQMDLCTFQSRISKALLLGKKEEQTPKRRRSFTIMNDEAVCKKQNVVANPIPVDDVRYDRFGHFPVFINKQKHCRYCPSGYSYISCSKCKVQLCLVKNQNCFLQFHCK